jgi:solute carrier family 25 aspartate/glutamate transporter 12/13
MAGGGAGFTQVAATNPMEIVKLRMQLQNLKPAAEQLSTMQVVRELGLSGLYRGIVITWMRDIPYSILFFPGYAFLKDQFSDDNGHAGIGQILLAGAIAGASAAWACTPADCIKTRYQAETKAGAIPYKSIADCYTRTVKEEGYSALFKGSVPRMSVTAPLFGIALLAFELQKRFLKGEPLL